MSSKQKNKWLEIYKNPKKHDELASYEDPKNIIVKEIKKIANLRNKIILDLGAGTGRHTFLYSKTAKQIYAIDPSKEHIKFLKDEIKKNNIKNITPKSGRAEKIPLGNNSVDVVVSIFSIASAFVDKNKSIKEILRVLKPGGKIVIVDTYHEGEFIDIWRKNSDKHIAGGAYNNMLKTKDMYNFKIKVINTSWDFPTFKKAADLFGYVIGGKTKSYLLKNKKKRIKMKVFIAYGIK